MYVFLGTLTERAFPGLLLPSASTNLQMQAGVPGVVSFSLSLEAMGFLPPNRSQLRCLHEALWDVYTPSSYHKGQGGWHAEAGQTVSLRVSHSLYAQLK